MNSKRSGSWVVLMDELCRSTYHSILTRLKRTPSTSNP